MRYVRPATANISINFDLDAAIGVVLALLNNYKFLFLANETNEPPTTRFFDYISVNRFPKCDVLCVFWIGITEKRHECGQIKNEWMRLTRAFYWHNSCVDVHLITIIWRHLDRIHVMAVGCPVNELSAISPFSPLFLSFCFVMRPNENSFHETNDKIDNPINDSYFAVHCALGSSSLQNNTMA